MIIIFQKLTSLFPLLILGLSIITIMICIAWQRSHFISAALTIIGLSLAFFSLYFVLQNTSTDLIPLICLDKYSVYYIGLILISSIVTSSLAYNWLYTYPGNRDEFYLLILISTIGCVVLACTNHLVTFFLGIELISMPLFGMVGYALCRKYSIETSIKYTLLSMITSSFFLFGIALIYAYTGQLSFNGIYQIINESISIKPVILAGFGMMIVSIGFKLSLVPFHLWTPDIYQKAPSPVSFFLATATKIATFAALTRFFLYIPIINNKKVQLILIIIAFVSMLLGNLMALNQNSIKRILSYSSISHIGYLLVGLITIQSGTLAIEAIVMYLSGYMLANLGAFGIISLMSNSCSDNDMDSLSFYRGLFWRDPFLSFILTLIILSLAGIPITFGFIGKFYIITLSLNNHLSWLTGAIVISSVIGLFCYLNIITNLYLPLNKKLHHNTVSSWILTTGGIMVIISSILLIIIGLYPQLLIKVIQLLQLTI